MHLLVDSTGLKLCGAGEWLHEKHGTKTRRAWRTLHIGTDADTGHIVTATLTSSDACDASQVGPLLEQIAGPVASFTADGAYDQDGVYDEVAMRRPDAAVVVPTRSNAVSSDTAETANAHLNDRHAWPLHRSDGRLPAATCLSVREATSPSVAYSCVLTIGGMASRLQTTPKSARRRLPRRKRPFWPAMTGSRPVSGAAGCSPRFESSTARPPSRPTSSTPATSACDGVLVLGSGLMAYS